MSDVRSLLRNERAARRVNHPQAQYTSTGVLLCKACQSQIKSDALWPNHLSSTQHINTLKRLAAGLKSQSKSSKGTKRKADDDEEEEVQLGALTMRKRARADEEHATPVADEPEKTSGSPAENPTNVGSEGAGVKLAGTQLHGTIDEDEWAAFERDVVAKPSEAPLSRPQVTSADATISAAPLTAAELAARSREEASVQAKERREAETEGEKEDAQRRLEEEFDQMEELEERIRRLKNKREALRQQLQVKRNASAEAKDTAAPNSEDVDRPFEEEESDSDDDWDNWGA